MARRTTGVLDLNARIPEDMTSVDFPFCKTCLFVLWVKEVLVAFSTTDHHCPIYSSLPLLNPPFTGHPNATPMYPASPLLLSLLVASWLTSSVFSFGIGGLKQTSKQPEVAKPTVQFGPQVTLIQSTQDYLDFISHDDRLCVVK